MLTMAPRAPAAQPASSTRGEPMAAVPREKLAARSVMTASMMRWPRKDHPTALLLNPLLPIHASLLQYTTYTWRRMRVKCASNEAE